MEITWLGRNCFRLRGREGVVITDPCPKDSGYNVGKPTADVITLSRRDEPGYSALSVVADGARVLDAPGEYEIGGVLVTGVATKLPDGQRNIVFVVELDTVRVAHLGLIAAAPSASVLEEIGDIDVLLLPAGGVNSLAPALAQDVMTAMDPRIAIPMNYKTDVETMDLEPLDRFVSETGIKSEPQPRLQVTKASLPSQLSVVILQPK